MDLSCVRGKEAEEKRRGGEGPESAIATATAAAAAAAAMAAATASRSAEERVEIDICVDNVRGSSSSAGSS